MKKCDKDNDGIEKHSPSETGTQLHPKCDALIGLDFYNEQEMDEHRTIPLVDCFP